MRPWACIWVIAGFAGLAASLKGAEVGLIKINGAIGPATASYIARALDLSEARGDRCLVLQLDTPGGLLDSTKQIVQSFYSAKIPVVVYVAPAGAGATSAGCFVTLAADIAAMAPNTTIGAAHTVLLGPAGGEKVNEVMKQKLENFGSSYIEAIARKRGRNVEWAIASVRESASITSEKALELKVINIISPGLPDLLAKLDGHVVNGRPMATAGANVVEIPMAARERLFQLLWRPEVMLVLMLMATYGIIGELSNPGAVLPGVVGGIALILALYMAAILPVNAAGLALIGLALVLFVIDLYATTHGVLTLGGMVAFFLGALMLFDRSDPAFAISLAFIVPATLVTAGFFLFVAGAGLRAQWLPVRTGKEAMLGKTVAVVQPINGRGGKVLFEGEYWNAVSDAPAAPGHKVEIVGIEGLTLKVKPVIP